MAFALHLDGVAHEVEIVARRPQLRLKLDGRQYSVTSADQEGDGRQAIEIDGERHTFVSAHSGGRQFLRMAGRTFEAKLVDISDAAHPGAAEHDHVRAPMPCSLIEIHKQPGDPVARGETLVTIESMKLQIALLAPRDGTLSRLLRGIGEKFDKDEIVAELEPLDGA